MDLIAALRAQDLEVEHYYPELGHGQQEVVIRHAPALRAADNHVLYRETVRGVAFRHGLWASLAPKPHPRPGRQRHPPARLADRASPPAGPRSPTPPTGYGLSQTGYHFIGGLIAHLPALVALTCGSVNSYRRLQPQFWSSAFIAYGMDNREARVRICSPLGGDPDGINLELKPSDSTANPYLALGALIHAGLDGMQRQLDPGEPVDVDPATLSEAEREAVGRPPPAQDADRGAGRPGGRQGADGRRSARCGPPPTWPSSAPRRPRSPSTTPPGSASTTSRSSNHGSHSQSSARRRDNRCRDRRCRRA